MTAQWPRKRAPHATRRHGSLLRRKHALVIALLVCSLLILLGATEMLFSYREARHQIGHAQAAQAAELAGTIRATLGLVERQLMAVTTLPWHGAGWLGLQDRREEYLRLLRIAPSVESVNYEDAQGRNVLLVSRRDADLADASAGNESVAVPSRSSIQCVYSRVSYSEGYEPVVTLALSSSERPSGRTIARVNLRGLADEVEAALTVEGANAYVVDAAGTIVLHRNHSLMLERRQVARLGHVAAALQGEIAARSGIDSQGAEVIASSSSLQPMGWTVLVEQHQSTALAPAVDTLLRTGAFVLAGIALSIFGAYYLANRLTQPILALHAGAHRLEKGEFDTHIDVRTGDELEQLAAQFNKMSTSIRDAYSTLEDKVAEKTRDLEIANRHKSEFLAHMSHELRTPLTAIIGCSDALSAGLFGPLNDDQKEYTVDIHDSGRHLLSLINDILDLSKIEAGRLELEPAEFDVAAAMRNAATLVRDRCRQKNLALAIVISPAVRTWVADQRRFKQVLVNLLSNAVKFTPPGGTIELGAAVDADELEVWVKDSGVGIDADELPLLFEQYRQLGAGTSQSAEGTGLGLSLVRRLVEVHGGRIEVTSEPQRGSTFTIRIPRGQA